MARPPKAPEDRAVEQISVRFTTKERKQLDSLTVHLRARSSGEAIRIAVAEMYERVIGKT